MPMYGSDPTQAIHHGHAAHAPMEPATARRASHVLLVDRKRQLVLKRQNAPGLPHGMRLTSGIVANVDAGESYEAAATRAMRETFGHRAPELRHVETTWIDRDGGRTFLHVFVALYDGDVPSTHIAVPIADIARAARNDDRALDGAFLRAFRAVHGNDW